MLQIVQGMYFRDVPLTHTVQRGIFYTNLRVFRDQGIEFPFGRVLPSTAKHGPRTLTVEAIEQLETLTPSGSHEVLGATSGEQLLDEIAAVMAFCLNITCVRDHDMARRLMATHPVDAGGRGPASLLRQTFDPMVVLKDETAADLVSFMEALIALERKSYEAAMRAIRQIVDATLIVDEDAALAYTLMVAALESLGQSTEPPQAAWADYDAQKRARIDAATTGLDDEVRKRIEDAVLANERHHLQRQFVAFVLDHVEPSFYRADAVGAIRAIRSTDLPGALRQAYAIRSRTVHSLEKLAREVWMAGDRADTTLLNSGIVLSLEGLARLSRHVVRRFVDRAPRGVDAAFNYRSALPDIMPARWAPEIWIGNASGFDRKSAPEYFEGMLDFLIDGMSKGSEVGLVDMTAVMAVIETSAAGLSKREDRLPMAGMMTLWNAVAPQEHRRVLKPKLAKTFETDLEPPSMVSLAVSLLIGRTIVWEDAAVVKLADARWQERLGNKFAPMPARIDAAIHLLAADRLLGQGHQDLAMGQLSRAVDTVPGLADLIKYEHAIGSGRDPVLNLMSMILGKAEFVDWKVPA